MTKTKLLMVDDEPEIGALVKRLAEGIGYEMQFTDHAESFKAAYRAFQPDVVVLDLAIPETDGVELLDFLVQQSCRAKILLMSGIDPSIRDLVHRLGIARGLTMAGVIPKPIRANELRSILTNVMQEAAPVARPDDAAGLTTARR